MGLEAKTGQIESIDNADDHITLIRLQWRQFAALAWQKYLSDGRGAIIIDLGRAAREGTNLNVPSYYVSDSSDALMQNGGWPEPDIAEVVRSYDPELDVVFVVLRVNGESFYYNVSDEPSPPKAYAEFMTRGSDREP